MLHGIIHKQNKHLHCEFEGWWKLMKIDEYAWKSMKWLSFSGLWQNLANGQVFPCILKKAAIWQKTKPFEPSGTL